MGSISGLLGLGGGANGTGFAAPAAANIVNPTNAAQTNAAYNGVQNNLGSQQQLLQALQGQQGLQNQSNVYNQLQGVANGTGPNPAQAELAQATGQNVANQAALAAGQRGASSNVGLMARQAAQAGAGAQQQAAGQAATLQANQSLNALGQMGGLANQQASQQIGQTNANTGAQQAEQAALINAQAGVNSNNVASQSSQNSTNAALAGATMTGQQNLIGNLTGAAGVASGLIPAAKAEGGLIKKMADGGVAYPGTSEFGNFNPNSVSAAASPAISNTPMQFNANAFQSGIDAFTPDASTDPASTGNKQLDTSLNSTFNNAQTPMQAALGTGLTADPMATAAFGAQNMMASGGSVGPQSYFGKMLAGNTPSMASNAAPFAKGGPVKALVSPGEKYLPPKEVEKVKQGANPMKVGETIPGKPKVSGAKNSYANDTVPKTLQEGGIVLPRSVTQAKDPSKAAASFVGAILQKQALSKGKK